MKGNQIIFGEQAETTGDRLSLLKGWAQEHEAYKQRWSSNVFNYEKALTDRRL
jgi:hypothetical protein